MLGRDAFQFSRAISDLWLLEDICDRAAGQTLDADQINDTRDQVRVGLSKVEILCGEAGLHVRLQAEINRFRAAIETDPFDRIASRIDHLRERIIDELSDRSCFYISPAGLQLYEQVEPFGHEVASRFAASADEFREASKCLALRQSTASVFHLMRGMENAVKQLAATLGIPISPGTTWRELTNSMDAVIKPMKNTTEAEKENKNNWESARINLHHLGSVVRNNTMHPNTSHTQDEATHIYDASRVVMLALCKLL